MVKTLTQSPVTSHQSPVPSHQSPVPSPQSPVPRSRSPVNSPQLAVIRTTSPACKHHAPVTYSHQLHISIHVNTQLACLHSRCYDLD
ncbi:hypothetical protein [Sphaerospermopsis reniformis]|uniref:hypothetical protein n=1 Tax=Sphaerospermopsis reniformis TaxID=531300 RepID=UPI0010F93D6E|nr:hypothetical protein [Sphaerospermopsis reniformis]